MKSQTKACPQCGGAMARQIVPCTDPSHGDTCTEVHVGWQCTFCGYVEGQSIGSTEDSRTVKRKIWN